MTMPLGIRTVWKSLLVVAGIALAGVAWLSWRAPPSQPACGGIIVVDVPPRTTSDDDNDTELTKADILVGMRPVRALVTACYDHFHVPGLAHVEMEISPEGTVTSARILGSFYGTATGACVEAAVHHALFRPTKTASNIDYPFLLRPPPPSSSGAAESEALLADARDAYVHGRYDTAIALARKAVKEQPIPAWRLIGASSCFLHDRDGAMRAWGHCDHQGRAFLHYVCARSAVTIP